MVASAKEMVSASEAELEKFNDKAPKLAQDGAKKYSETLGKDGSVLASVTSKQMTQSAYNQLVNAPFDQAANANVKNTRIPWERLEMRYCQQPRTTWRI